MGGWLSTKNDHDPWLQVTLDGFHELRGIITQGVDQGRVSNSLRGKSAIKLDFLNNNQNFDILFLTEILKNASIRRNYFKFLIQDVVQLVMINILIIQKRFQFDIWLEIMNMTILLTIKVKRLFSKEIMIITLKSLTHSHKFW